MESFFGHFQTTKETKSEKRVQAKPSSHRVETQTEWQSTDGGFQSKSSFSQEKSRTSQFLHEIKTQLSPGFRQEQMHTTAAPSFKVREIPSQTDRLQFRDQHSQTINASLDIQATVSGSHKLPRDVQEAQTQTNIRQLAVEQLQTEAKETKAATSQTVTLHQSAQESQVGTSAFRLMNTLSQTELMEEPRVDETSFKFSMQQIVLPQTLSESLEKHKEQPATGQAETAASPKNQQNEKEIENETITIAKSNDQTSTRAVEDSSLNQQERSTFRPELPVSTAAADNTIVQQLRETGMQTDSSNIVEQYAAGTSAVKASREVSEASIQTEVRESKLAAVQTNLRGGELPDQTLHREFIERSMQTMAPGEPDSVGIAVQTSTVVIHSIEIQTDIADPLSKLSLPAKVEMKDEEVQTQDIADSQHTAQISLEQQESEQKSTTFKLPKYEMFSQTDHVQLRDRQCQTIASMFEVREVSSQTQKLRRSMQIQDAQTQTMILQLNVGKLTTRSPVEGVTEVATQTTREAMKFEIEMKTDSEAGVKKEVKTRDKSIQSQGLSEWWTVRDTQTDTFDTTSTVPIPSREASSQSESYVAIYGHDVEAQVETLRMRVSRIKEFFTLTTRLHCKRFLSC